MSTIKKFRSLLMGLFVTAIAFSCGNEPEKILFKGPQFVFFEASEVVPLLENSSSVLQIPVKVSLARKDDVTVAYEIENNNVVEGVDYEIVSPNPVTIPAGEYETFIEVEVINNAVFEAESRNFTITITDITGAASTPQVLGSLTVEIVNDDCLPEIPKIANWIGSLSVEDVGAGAVPGQGSAGPDGSCGGVLVVQGDLLAFGLDSKINISFTQDSEGATTGTVEVARDRFFIDDTFAGYQYEATGVYDEETQEILMDYTFYRPNGTVWFVGQHYITLD